MQELQETYRIQPRANCEVLEVWEAWEMCVMGGMGCQNVQEHLRVNIQDKRWLDLLNVSMGISMKNDEKLVRVMVKQGMDKLEEVEGGCW